jgi:hypothetical protein
MMNHLDTNKKKWDQLLEAEQARGVLEGTEIPEHLLADDSDSMNLNTEVIRKREALETARENSSRSVRFDTTVTTASDSDSSEGDEMMYGGPSKPIVKEPRFEAEFLGIPRPDGRRHSIATGLMGDNIQLPGQRLFTVGSAEFGSSSGSLLSISDLVGGETSTGRIVGRTVMRRESLPGQASLYGGKNLSSKTIIHLQKICSRQLGEGLGGSTSPGGSISPGDIGDIITGMPTSPIRIATEKSSCSSTSTTDELLDFTYTLPEGGQNRGSGSPRRLLHDATDFDELCPSTSILSMSNRVAHITLQQGVDLEDQRRHLIRQQTCPVVSLNADGSFNRPRFLSAAAAISPTAVASSSIITQHRMRNKSPESGGEGEGGTGMGMGTGLGSGRGSGGSSSEALKFCEVISEEADRQSSGSSAEASPLEIFVQQFPPVSDDNDGEAPRRGSGSLDPSDFLSVVLTLDPSPDGSSEIKQLPFDDQPSSSSDGRGPRLNLSVSCQSEPGDWSNDGVSESRPPLSPQGGGTDDYKESLVPSGVDGKAELSETERETGHSSANLPSTTATTYDSSTQTDASPEKENLDPSRSPNSNSRVVGSGNSLCSALPLSPGSSGVQAPAIGGASGNRLATILMWRNNHRLWKSLTEEEHDETPSDPDDPNLNDYFERWDVRVPQQAHQVVSLKSLILTVETCPSVSMVFFETGERDRSTSITTRKAVKGQKAPGICYDNTPQNSISI